jgi:hypothetical protein
VIGALCNSDKESAQVASRKHGLDVTVSYRHQTSFRHFIGTDEQVQREINHNQIFNRYSLFDIAVEYRLNQRWSLTGSIPVLDARRDQLYAPKGVYHVTSFGDATVGARAWVFRPPTENGGNVGLGISLKMPTGQYDATSRAIAGNGQPIVATADQSIQAGDGGWGFSLDMQAYHPGPLRTMLYLSGTYLFNPEETNGVKTFRTKPHEQVMSVADQYLYRGGITHNVPWIRGLTASIGGRIEGVPVRDAFGGSDGFRRPGYAISVDPGFMLNKWNSTIAVNVPWAVERNRRQSVPDMYNGTHGDAAFADYALILSVTRHF